MTATYDLLASTLVTTNTTNVTFDSIPSTYRDLIVVGNVLGSSTIPLRFRINNDTTANYNRTHARGDGGSAASGRSANATESLITSDFNLNNTEHTSFRMNIFDYQITDKQKTILVRADRATSTTEMSVTRWGSNAAINTVSLYVSGGNNIIPNSRFYLYGIRS
jgi:hypothetical protein